MVATLLPSSFHFVGVQTYQAGQQQHSVAFFDWRIPTEQSPRSFALIPGGRAPLGYDWRSHPVLPENLIRQWQIYHYGYYDLIHLHDIVLRDILEVDYNAFSTFFGGKLHPLRTVTLQPFLLERVAQEAEELFLLPPCDCCLLPSECEIAEVCDLMRRRGPIPHRDVVAFLDQQGFRLPSSDEWEYACSAGSCTLFYWGDEFVGAFAQPAPHNAFGLSIVNDTYQWEYCDDPTLMRGGDGGVAVCGGSGMLAETLPRASAYLICLIFSRRANGRSRLPYQVGSFFALVISSIQRARLCEEPVESPCSFNRGKVLSCTP